MDLQRRGERHTMYTVVQSFSLNMVHQTTSKSFEKGGELEQPIWTVVLEAMVRSVASTRKEDKKYNKVTTLLNNFTKHGVNALAGLVKEKCRVETMRCLLIAFSCLG